MSSGCVPRVLCRLAVVLFASGVRADEGGGQPLRATIDVGESLAPTSTPGVFTVTLGGSGYGAPFGALTFAATETIDFRQFSQPDLYPEPRAVVTDGRLTITAANGDQLTATYEGYGVPDPSRPGFFLGYATATLTGGTGRFQCASGTVPFTLDIDVAALTEVVTFDGTANLYCEGGP